MGAKRITCLLLGLLIAFRSEATQLTFGADGKITGSVADAYATYGKAQVETSGLLYKKMLSMGFEPSSTAATNTIHAVESVAVGAASGARSGFGGGWIGIVAGAVIGAVVQGAIALGLDKLLTWLFGSGDSVTSTTLSPIQTGSFYFAVFRVWPDACGNPSLEKDFWTDTDAATAWVAANNAQTGAPAVCSGVHPGLTYGAPTCNGSGGCTVVQTVTSDGSQTTLSIPISKIFGTNPPNVQDSVPSGTTTTTTDIATAVGAISAAEQAQPVSPELMADTTNALWQEASQESGYQGVPYDPSNPITTQDATDWQNVNSGYTPTVGDAVGTGTGAGTQGQSGSGVSIGALPVSGQPGSSDPTTGVNTGSGTGTGNGTGTSSGQCGGSGEPPCEVDWGSNPNTAQPSLESTPTIQMILGPILNMLPGFTSFQVPVHASACPTATFSMFGQTYTMDQHCTIFEQNRAAISGAFAVLFLLASVFIVLTA